MKFAFNWYRVDYHVCDTGLCAIPGAQLADRVFGWPPFEVRPIWIVEIADLDALLSLADELGVEITVSRSAWWSGSSLDDPGQQLYGLSFVDEIERPIDPRDRPIRIVGASA